jgi:hypothetical protein
MDYRGVTRWMPDPKACDDCGADANRRWHRGEKLVCVNCIEWRQRGL